MWIIYKSRYIYIYKSIKILHRFICNGPRLASLARFNIFVMMPRDIAVFVYL